jgi:hypothetical protein
MFLRRRFSILLYLVLQDMAISGGKGRPDELNIRPFSSSNRGVVAPTPSRSVKEARQFTFIRREVVH